MTRKEWIIGVVAGVLLGGMLIMGILLTEAPT